MLGYADSELADTYEAWLDLLHPEDSAAAPDKAGRKFKVGARPFGVEFRMKHKLGHWAWIQCVGLQMVSPWGDLERVIGIHIDATERKELEEAAVASDARLHALADDGVAGRVRAGLRRQDVLVLRRVAAAARRTVPAPENGPGALAEALPPEECPAGIEAWLLDQAPGQTSFTRAVRLRTKGRPDVPRPRRHQPHPHPEANPCARRRIRLPGARGEAGRGLGRAGAPGGLRAGRGQASARHPRGRARHPLGGRHRHRREGHRALREPDGLAPAADPSGRLRGQAA